MDRNRRASPQTLSLLEILAANPRSWRHGYELAVETGLKSGTLYPALIRLGDRGFLESRWQPAGEPGRPPRHLYRLTASGLAFAKAQLAFTSRTLRVARALRASA